MHLKLCEINTIIISSPETAKQVLKTHDLAFATRPFSLATKIISYGNCSVVFAPYGDYWRQLRKMFVLELLSVKRVQSFRPIREEEMLNIMQMFSGREGSSINFSTILYKYMNCVISRAAFGKVKRKEQEGFIGHVKEIMEVSAGFSVADLFPSVKFLQNVGGMKSKMERLQFEADKILESIADDHKERKKTGQENIDEDHDDLVDVLLKFQEDQKFGFAITTNNIKSAILDIFIAGSETSSTVVEWTISELLKNPKVMEKAQAEIRQVYKEEGYVDEAKLRELNYLKMVIKEALRLYPHLPLLLPRESLDECEINGYHISKNTQLLVNAWAIGKDPKYWNEPRKFDPERLCDGKIDYKGGNFELIPFGSGRRVCPGITFGVLNVELPLANLPYHFDWKLSGEMKPEDLDMNEAYGLTSKRKNVLNLIPLPRHPLPVV